MTVPRVLLVDSAEGPGRTTATLVASLAARLSLLHVISGADAAASVIAGYAALGREVSQTEEGARMRAAIEKGRPGANGEALWSALHIGEWASNALPTPVLDQLRNDVAVLLVDDLDQTLQTMPIPCPPTPHGPPAPAKVNFPDYLLGMWAFSQELVRSIESLAAPTLTSSGAFTEAAGTVQPGPLLR
jgi:hypothetical protein